MKITKIILLITFILLIRHNLSASNFTSKDSIILYSMEKYIEFCFNRVPVEKRHGGKPIYWVNLIDVDTTKNEWRFAHTETDRRNTYLVKDFKIDNIIDYGHYLLLISYNDMMFKNNGSNTKAIDSLIFSEEPNFDPCNNDGFPIVYIMYCRVKYSCKGKYELFQQSIMDVLPQSLSYFTFQVLYDQHKYSVIRGWWNSIYSEQNEKTKAKLDMIIEKALNKQLKQEEFIYELAKNCEMIKPKIFKIKFK